MGRRIAIVGNGGGGKSTVARKLSEALELRLFFVDQVQFKPGWEREDHAVVAAWHEQILTQSEWIIDGWGAWSLIEARFERADTILLIDFPLDLHLAGARMREETAHNDDAPPGCDYRDVVDLMTETLEMVDRDLMPKLRELVERQRPHKTVEVARTPAERDEIVNLWATGAFGKG